MHRVLVPSLVLMMTACDPQNATFTAGDFTAWLAETNSLTVARGDVLRFDEESGELEASLQEEYDNYFTIDCREFEAADGDPEVNEALRLDNRARICPNERNEPDSLWPPVHETWLQDNGYHVINDTFEAWRGEAIITSEGDAQLSFHHALPNGENFRFSVVIDPNFQPRRCVQKGDGVEYEDVDGDWVDNWSKGSGGKQVFHLNAGAYQFNPDNFSNANERQRWFLPVEWRAGHAEGRFGDDNFRVRSNRYAEPRVYVAEEGDGLLVASFTERDLYYCNPITNTSGDRIPNESCLDALADRVADDGTEVGIELSYAGIPNNTDLPSPVPLVEDNAWRTFDGFASGIDSWGELAYSWIAFDPGTVFEIGGAGSGEFNIFFDGVDSNSRFHVRGRFTISGWANDFWATEYLPDTKAIENETVLCGETAGSDEG